MPTQHSTDTGTQEAQRGNHISNALIALEIVGIFVVALSASSTVTYIGLALMLIPIVSLYGWLTSASLCSDCATDCKNTAIISEALKSEQKVIPMAEKAAQVNQQTQRNLNN